MLSPQKIRRYSSTLTLTLGIALTAYALFAPGAVASGTGSIEGEIVAEDGGPLAGVWSCAYLVQSEEFEENCDFTGSDGIFAIHSLEAGEYKVEFWSEATEPSYVGEYYDNKLFWEEADEVKVEEGVATTGIDAALAEGATIEGEIRAASLGGPVEFGLTCASLPASGPMGCAMTRKDGSYTLSGLPAGEYRIGFVPAAFIYNLLNQFYDHKSEPAEADLLAIAAGETKTGIDADLEAGAEIHGTVYSATNETPLSRVGVCALFFEEVLATWFPKECVPTSASGRYKLLALPTDSYKVVFSPEFKEFGFEEEEGEDDGFFAQYFDRKSTLAEANLLTLTAPEVRTGIDGFLQPEHPMDALVAPIGKSTIVGARAGRAHPNCRPGFRKRKVSGKQHCVKTHKHRHKRHHRRRHGSA
jgi:hypothetical protein